MNRIAAGLRFLKFSQKDYHAMAAPEMPPCDYQPKKYTGLHYDKIQEIREDHLVPCIVSYYKKPLLIHDGYMQWLFDHTGKRYLDMFGGVVTVSVGHCHPTVNKAAKEQMETLWHTTNIYMHPKVHEYAEKLTAKLPGDLKFAYFVNTDSEANDLALIMARLHTKHFDIISFRNAYHGMSTYTMGLTALSTWRINVPIAQGIHHAMNPDVYQGIWGGAQCRDSPAQTTRTCDCQPNKCQASDLYYDQLEAIFKYSLPRGQVAGLFAEAVQGLGGIVQFPKGYLKRAYELVRINGGVCIADEVQSGFGRTGEHFWGFEMHGVKPDIVTMARAIGNGFPMAAVVTTPEIAKTMGQVLDLNTFGGNALGSAVGLAVLKVIEDEQAQRNCLEVGTHLIKQLALLRDEFECIGDVRGKGLMVGIEMVADKDKKTPISAKQFMEIWEDCKDMGVLLGRGGLCGNVLRMQPPMCITKADADFTVDVIRRVLLKQRLKNKKTQDRHK
ncbi:alanine--glyoxylate aminotransferase 2, mitochondrial-like isoform X1 [Schistocerca americana]|nr:alanine--glyoxylate aminotransferase 2, mitochondrial-like isoform X1 [Schistocerca americana]XP_046993139.1 alanine--glyoxylate aminotransferase 2, mitochondrial-like isoform X1 [Schistocerca americana]XP_049957501.1 alanine--glyoxylate aminotransferase 2, mitochondrial isoform X1 [Schistocerca serialis cubense]